MSILVSTVMSPLMPLKILNFPMNISNENFSGHYGHVNLLTEKSSLLHRSTSCRDESMFQRVVIMFRPLSLIITIYIYRNTIVTSVISPYSYEFRTIGNIFVNL